MTELVDAKEELIERFWDIPFRHDVDNDSRIEVLLSWIKEPDLREMVQSLERLERVDKGRGHGN